MTDITLALTDGARFVVRRHGNPQQPRLLVGHGTGFAIDGFRRLWSPLCDTFDVITYDLRHHGRNEPCDPATITAERQNADLREILAGIGETFGERPTAGLFHSISGLAALRVETADPGTFSGLVLMEPPAPPPGGHPLAEAFDAGRRMLAERSARRQEHFSSVEELSSKYQGRSAFALFEDGAADELAASILKPEGSAWTLCCSPEAESRFYATNFDDGLFDRLDLAGCPVIVVVGSNDREISGTPAQVAPELARIGGFKLLELSDATHMMPLERPLAVADATRTFMTSVN